MTEAFLLGNNAQYYGPGVVNDRIRIGLSNAGADLLRKALELVDLAEVQNG